MCFLSFLKKKMQLLFFKKYIPKLAKVIIFL